MDVLSVIPARGGSKTLPRKNLAPVNGLSLIGWTIKAAKKSRSINRVVVSTDNIKIKQESITLGAEVPFMRPKELALDDVHSVEVILHALRWFKKEEEYTPDVVIMLLPTSPLRKPLHIDEAYKIFIEKKAPSVISVTPSTPAGSLRYLHPSGLLENVINGCKPNYQRQDVEQIYAVNGSIYIATPDTLFKEGTFHVPGAFGYVMPKHYSVDVNDRSDLIMCAKLLSK